MLIKTLKIYPIAIQAYSSSMITFAIETIGDKSKRPEIDASYQHISKSEATNLDHDFIVLALSKLENQNTILIKPTSQGFDSFFIAAHTGIKDQQNIKPLTQHDNAQLNPIYFQPKLNLI